MAGKHQRAWYQRLLQVLLPEASLPSQQKAAPKVKKERTPKGERVPLGGQFYFLCYVTGLFVCEVMRRIGRLCVRLVTPLWRWLCRLWQRVVMRRVRRQREEWHRLRYELRLARERVAAAHGGERLLAWLRAMALPITVMRHHRRFWRLVGQSAAVVTSLAILLGVWRYWQNTTFALELTYAGESIGYITDESVLQNALSMAQGRVVKLSAEGNLISYESALNLRPVHQSAVLTDTELCDKIIQLSDSEVTQMSGLYIDGRFEGALATRSAVQSLLDEILEGYRTASSIAESKAEFVNRVEIVDGLYPLAAREDYRELKARLTEQDEHGTPYLTVQIRCTEVYEEDIPFETTTVRDRTKYIGYFAVRTHGVNGKKQITADVVYLNGVEQSREILSEQVLEEPVTQVNVEGAYRLNADNQPGVSTGEFMWPVPSCRTVYSPYGYRWGKLHAGIDISGGGIYGQAILSADGGVVKQVNTEGWGGGYGLYVIVDHGNGYVTVYAHCSEILVTPGQKVRQGELIARVGNTGQSFGAHLHFEIRVNGASVDPVPYL